MKETPRQFSPTDSVDSSASPDTDPIRQKCAAEIFSPNEAEREAAWEKIKNDVLAIESEVFGDRDSTEELLAKDFTNPNNDVVLIRDKETGKVVGYSYAELDDIHTEKPGDTALISVTFIHPNYQHHHLVADLMAKLEPKLIERGYEYMERYSNYDDGYASKIAKAYDGRIVEQGEPVSETEFQGEKEDYGFKRVRFLIKLRKKEE